MPAISKEKEQSPFMTLIDAAAYLCVSRPTLYHMAKKGETFFVRMAGRTLMRREEVLRLAAEAEVVVLKPLDEV